MKWVLLPSQTMNERNEEKNRCNLISNIPIANTHILPYNFFLGRYEANLVAAKNSGILRGAMVALSGGLVFGIMYAMYGLGFWFGIKLIMDDRYVRTLQCTI